jgi:hypothetical protein
MTVAFGNVARGLTCAAMIDEVQAETGTTDTDEPLATEARVTQWINDGQRVIVRKIAGLESLLFKNTGSHDITQKLAYSLNDVTVGDSTTTQEVARVFDVWYWNGLTSRRLIYLPTDQFDRHYPDPTNSDQPTSLVKHWTRRGGQIELAPLCSSTYWDDDIRIDGDYYPADFTADSGSYSDISMEVHEGLILYSNYRYYRAAAITDKKRDAWNEFFGEGGWLDRFREHNNTMEAWDGDFFWET